MAATTLTKSEFNALTANEFAASPLIDDMLAAAGVLVGELWGQLRSQGHMARTAHLLTMAGASSAGGGESGPVASRAIGAISISYATAAIAAGDESLARTKWGRLYLDMRAVVMVGPTVAGVAVV
jgi:hypothetical protein